MKTGAGVTDRLTGAVSERDCRLDFDRRVLLEFHGSKIGSDGGLPLFRELDETLGPHDLAAQSLRDTRRGQNTIHTLAGLPRQSIFGRLAGYPDVNDADRLSRDPVMRQIAGVRAVDGQAASTSQMARFETDVPTSARNCAALAELSGQWIDAMHDAHPPSWITLDMDGSVSPTHGDREGKAWNGHFGCKCHHPLFAFNRFSELERRALRKGNFHSADGWKEALAPVIAHHKTRDLTRLFRAVAAFALPGLYELLEEEECFHTIRLKGDAVSQEAIAHLLKRPVGRPPNYVRRFYHDFEYQAASWDKVRRVIAKVEWRPGDLFPRVGFVVTNLPIEPEWIIRFYNRRGTAEQHIKQGKYAINWTRLSCKRFRDNEVRLRLHALACSLGNFPERADLPEEVADKHPKPPDQNRGACCTSCPQDHLPDCRSCRAAQRVRANPGRHPRSQAATKACMTALTTRPVQKRLRRCVRSRPKWGKIGAILRESAHDDLKTGLLGGDTTVGIENKPKVGKAGPGMTLPGKYRLRRGNTRTC